MTKDAPDLAGRSGSAALSEGLERTVLPERADLYVARLKGGFQFHIRRLGERALCGIEPTSNPHRRMRVRAGWVTFRQDSKYEATCLKCIAARDRLPGPPQLGTDEHLAQALASAL